MDEPAGIAARRLSTSLSFRIGALTEPKSPSPSSNDLESPI
jgi:hypothetical protein